MSFGGDRLTAEGFEVGEQGADLRKREGKGRHLLVAHCGGGYGPNTFDMVTALEQWVEQGKAPSQIIASQSLGDGAQRTRPLCPYPPVGRWTGKGSSDEAAHFTCRAP